MSSVLIMTKLYIFCKKTVPIWIFVSIGYIMNKKEKEV